MIESFLKGPKIHKSVGPANSIENQFLLPVPAAILKNMSQSQTFPPTKKKLKSNMSPTPPKRG